MHSTNRFCGNSNQALVQYFKNSGIIKSDLVFNTMNLVDRKKFTTDPSKAYIDAPQLIGHGKTISSPHMHAKTLELFADKLHSGKRALDIGSGSGYLTTCMALALGEKGYVVGIECVPELNEMAKQIISSNYSTLLTNKRIKLVVRDGRLGYPSKGPYDIIHVGAAANEVPQTLIDQLALGGRLIMPLETKLGYQRLVQIDKLPDGRMKKEELMGVIYGHLTDVKERDIQNYDDDDDDDSRTSLVKDDTKLNRDIEKIFQRLKGIEEKTNKEQIEKEEQFQKLNSRIGDLEKNLMSLESKMTENIEKSVLENDNKTREEIEGIKTKVTKMNDGLITVNIELLDLQRKLTEKIDEEIITQSKELDDKRKRNRQWSELENKIEITTQKMIDLENKLVERTLEKTASEKTILPQASMIEIVEKAMKIQEIILDDKKAETEKGNVKWEEMKQKFESLEEDLKMLKCKSGQLIKEKDLITDKLEETTKELKITESRLETMEKEIKILQSKIATQPSMVELINKTLEIQKLTLEEKKAEKFSIEKQININDKWEKIGNNINDFSEKIKAIGSKLTEKQEDIVGNSDCHKLEERLTRFDKELQLIKNTLAEKIGNDAYARLIESNKTKYATSQPNSLTIFIGEIFKD